MSKKKVGKITGYKPVGSYILVEMLTAKEASGTMLELGVNAKPSVPQGYILDIGPCVKEEEYGFKVGDRVILVGNFVPLNSLKEGDRDLGVLLPHDIKSVVEESHE